MNNHTQRGSHGGPKGRAAGSRRPQSRPSFSARHGRADSARPNSPYRSRSSANRYGTNTRTRGNQYRGAPSFRARAGERRSKRTFGTYIDPARFVNRASPVEEVAYVPTHRFADFAISDELKDAIVTRGYTLPTAIQDQSIPLTLAGRDVVGLADTGSGKTGAFLIPLLDKVTRTKGERVLVVVPTRELAIQIQDELHALGKPLRIDSVCCVGGANISPQLRGLAHKPRFVIGTPGRLKDVIERKALRPEQFNTIVLDEADRMLDMGFINDMRYLMQLMPQERQTLFFSATLSPEIKDLIGEFLSNPETVSVKTRDTSRNVEQDIVRVPRGESKYDVLTLLLAKPDMEKVLIFGRTKHGVEKLAKMLSKDGFRAESIHGNKTHNHRQRALGKFRDDAASILVATDVAARGLDIPGVSHVINYDLPATHDDYVHRIGRTGRAGARGIALTFIEE